ncbi:hypothetical protein ACJ2A9_20940 [Anaerobacillus sp. MEB173]|uniref:hypothetical protein n=1 Tax=Anaerobacillus sp. MEB173 TaxID=3383345 RepID=UPI003F92D0D3
MNNRNRNAAISAVAQQEQPQCKHCQSEDVRVISETQYNFFLSTLPVLVAIIFMFTVHLAFFFLIPFVLHFNGRIAAKKSPLIVCRSCKSSEIHKQG